MFIIRRGPRCVFSAWVSGWNHLTNLYLGSLTFIFNITEQGGKRISMMSASLFKEIKRRAAHINSVWHRFVLTYCKLLWKFRACRLVISILLDIRDKLCRSVDVSVMKTINRNLCFSSHLSALSHNAVNAWCLMPDFKQVGHYNHCKTINSRGNWSLM